MEGLNDMDKETMNSEFPSNSKISKSNPEKTPDEKKLEKVISGNVKRQKRGIGKRIAETLLEDTTQSVGDYIFHDVLVPAAKSMICDIVGWGGFAEMLLFGSVRHDNRITRQGGRSFTSYGSYFNSSLRDKDRDPRDRTLSRTSRSRHEFDDLVLDTRGEAEDVLERLVDQTVDYGRATVADLYDLVGVTSEFTDNKYGWTDLRDASVNRVHGGYLINLPKAVLLD